MATTTNTGETNFNINDVFKYAKDERQVFITSDILLGTSALWLPVFLGIVFFQHTSPCAELIKLLDAGSGYTFALPFLAASASFVFIDRNKRRINFKRDQVAPDLVMHCIMYLIAGLILTGIHFTALIFDKSAGGITLNFLQIAYVCMVISFGRKLFCLKNMDKLPDEVVKYRAQERKAAANILDAAKKDDQF